MTAALLSSDGWWMLAVVLWVSGWFGIAAFVVDYRRRGVPERRVGPDPRPPALHVRRRPPYDWTERGD